MIQLDQQHSNAIKLCLAYQRYPFCTGLSNFDILDQGFESIFIYQI